MPINALVSIIIPVFNREEFLIETVNSIVQQTYTHWELLLVDDGSTDRSIQIAQEFADNDARVKSIQRDRNPKGAPTCRNIGLERATGEYIQFFDSDDIAFPNMLEQKIRVMSSRTELDFVVSKMADLKEDGGISYPDYSISSESPFFDMVNSRLKFLTPGPVFKRAYLNRFDIAFDERLPRHQEWEYYCRLLSARPSYQAIDEFHCARRYHPKSIKHLSDKTGKLKYRSLKMLAMKCLNENTKGAYVSTLYRIFKPYGITTFKVALYQLNIATLFYSITWLVKLQFSLLFDEKD